MIHLYILVSTSENTSMFFDGFLNGWGNISIVFSLCMRVILKKLDKEMIVWMKLGEFVHNTLHKWQQMMQ